MNSKIVKIEYILPEKVLTNDQLASEFPEWGRDKIAEKIGIRKRHIAAENETALDLAYYAGVKALEGFDKSSIDFVLLCTQSPDYFLPTSSCILQDRLGLNKNTGALDFNLGCSGFIYGLALAKGLIKTNISRNILLITAETYSKHIHIKDKSNRSIFGDAAAATIISSDENEHIYEFELGTDGSGMNNLIIPNGGMRSRYNPAEKDYYEDGNIRNNNLLYMNGPEIFNFTIENIPALINSTLEKNGMTIDSLDFIIFHQANKFILEYLRKKLKLPEKKFYINMEETGNTVSCTIPIALKDAEKRHLIKEGDIILLAGFGVGYSWGATIIKV
jgi:3-oxoacyl-[acyl-carrier-protein] synthase III